MKRDLHIPEKAWMAAEVARLTDVIKAVPGNDLELAKAALYEAGYVAVFSYRQNAYIHNGLKGLYGTTGGVIQAFYAVLQDYPEKKPYDVYILYPKSS